MLLADENVPAATIAWLRAQGYDVLSIQEVAPGIADEAVLGMGAADSRILLTFDRDYGELIFRHRKPSPRSVIYIHIYPSTVDELNALLLRLIRGDAGVVNGHMVVVSQAGIRKRMFPHPID